MSGGRLSVTRISTHDAARVDRAWDVLVAELRRLEGRHHAAPEPDGAAARKAAR